MKTHKIAYEHCFMATFRENFTLGDGLTDLANSLTDQQISKLYEIIDGPLPDTDISLDDLANELRGK